MDIALNRQPLGLDKKQRGGSGHCRLTIDSYLLAAATVEAAVDTALDGQLCLSSIRLTEFHLAQRNSEEAAVDTALDRQLPTFSGQKGWVSIKAERRQWTLHCPDWPWTGTF